MPSFKIFCVLQCGWNTVTTDENKLWGEYSKCPHCLGATDGYAISDKESYR